MPALLETSSSLADDLEMLCAADYPAEEVQWLWPGRIPIGKVTLLVGDPGNGKSLIALDIASRVSHGASWPDCPPSAFPHPPSPGSVLILSEDNIRDTIRPRLDAAGADPRRIFILPTVADLRHDLEKLRAALDRLPDCRLIVIDPANSYVGPGNSHFHTVVRRVFEPLATLAAERGIAVLAVSHLRKHDGAVIQRAAGSMGFVAAARAVWTVYPDPLQADRYLMMQVKNNFVAESAGLAYSIAPTESSTVGNTAPTIHWQTDPITASVVEAMQPEKNSRGPEPAELTLAMDYVHRELLTGPKSAEYMLAGAMGGGFTDRTVRRALVAIGGKTRKDRPYGFGSWLWYLPDHDYKDPEASPLGHQCAAWVGAVAPVPDKPMPVSSENLSPSQKNEGVPAETCPLREKTAKSAAVFEQPPPYSESTIIPPGNPSPLSRMPTPEQAWALIYQICCEGQQVPYDYFAAQQKLRRYLWVSSRRPKVFFKRVKIDLIKPHTFTHPRCCRDP
jgi:hypothetical protein